MWRNGLLMQISGAYIYQAFKNWVSTYQKQNNLHDNRTPEAASLNDE